MLTEIARPTDDERSGGYKESGVTDCERFRLRTFLDRLVEAGECLVVEEPIDLIDVAGRLEGETRAVWFKAAGPDRQELVGNVAGARSRLALAFGVSATELPLRLRDASSKTIAPVEVSSADARPVLTVELGDDKEKTLLG
uniref:UbiD family decarboxylase domain-containing protein n=1 Tax=Sphingomonas bacterium TaxID=1895847 RepID=UPI0015756E1F